MSEKTNVYVGAAGALFTPHRRSRIGRAKVLESGTELLPAEVEALGGVDGERVREMLDRGALTRTPPDGTLPPKFSAKGLAAESPAVDERGQNRVLRRRTSPRTVGSRHLRG